MKILLYPRLSDNAMQLAYTGLPQGMELTVVGQEASEDELANAIAGADVMMGFIQRPLPPKAVEAMGGLKLMQFLSAGYDALDIEAARKQRLLVANNGGANAVAVAEHAIMLMLAVYRNLVALDERVKTGGWKPGAALGAIKLYELAGKTVGLVGLGMIGREVAKRLRAFETTVLYYDVLRASSEVEKELGVQYAPLAELLPQADVLTLHVPLSPETESMIRKSELRSMKPSAILINTCRGAVVDNEALYEALRDDVIAAAGLDTVEPEPPPADMPLLHLPNVTITPHTAGPTVDSWPKRLRNGYANIQRVAGGQKPLWIIPQLRDLFQ